MLYNCTILWVLSLYTQEYEEYGMNTMKYVNGRKLKNQGLDVNCNEMRQRKIEGQLLDSCRFAIKNNQR